MTCAAVSALTGAVVLLATGFLIPTGVLAIFRLLRLCSRRGFARELRRQRRLRRAR